MTILLSDVKYAYVLTNTAIEPVNVVNIVLTFVFLVFLYMSCIE